MKNSVLFKNLHWRIYSAYHKLLTSMNKHCEGFKPRCRCSLLVDNLQSGASCEPLITTLSRNSYPSDTYKIVGVRCDGSNEQCGGCPWFHRYWHGDETLPFDDIDVKAGAHGFYARYNDPLNMDRERTLVHEPQNGNIDLPIHDAVFQCDLQPDAVSPSVDQEIHNAKCRTDGCDEQCPKVFGFHVSSVSQVCPTQKQSLHATGKTTKEAA